ncbi:hypothetical protein HYH02_007505 [Chlamydomonas schloesseri]|uniref:Guanylate cyclase domain-containing protein n=1 Tax=Chlamydomonas schloesseri TaxID=2026947 RepID=A0A835WHE8_9CHLO|nr:hypothetical protein HYH02_007505 [Chlamydomonas schloesseri]|eukprot:KAG2447582.1 hypothetical protein HYH02_007505 [Chlamydomonas schloesseri]
MQDEEAGSAQAELERQCPSAEANALESDVIAHERRWAAQWRAIASRAGTTSGAGGPPSPSMAARQAHARQKNFAAHSKFPTQRKKHHVRPWSSYSLLVLWQVIRESPIVLLGPLLLFLICCGLGIFGVLMSATQSVRSEQAVAKELVSDAARHIELQMQQAFSPSITLEIQVQQQPYFPTLVQSFEFVASRLLSKVLPGMIASLQLAPNGVTQAIYPLAGNQAAIGHDLLADPSRREDALRTIAYGNLTVGGPYQLLQGGFGVVLRQPVFVTPPSGAAGWEVAAAGDNRSSSSSSSSAVGAVSYGNGTEQYDPTFGANATRGDCPGTLCYDPLTGRRFWGFAQGLARLDGLLQGNDARMQRLSQYGPWHLTRVYDNGTESQLASSAVNGSAAGSGRCDSIADSPNGADADSGGPCVSVAVVLPNALWRLYLGKQDGWAPAWRAGLLALVVMGSAVVAGLLFGLLVSGSRHRALLEAMFPRKVLAPLQQGKNFSEEFDSVTILFTDIVAYTTLSGQMRPIEVAEMLNELYTIFDEICERNGCYKVETIGDAFVAVGGCPDAEPPEVAAERVAHMALDMVAATAGFTSSRGHRLRIRVGLASGPIAAAVIGVKMPRYCLFGDTVNMASRMESNSDPQRINLSPATAALLRSCASAPAFAVIPRGPITIKGKGPLECYWLEPAQQRNSGGSQGQLQLVGASSHASLGSSTWELLQPRQSLNSTSGGGSGALPAADVGAAYSSPGTLREARGRLPLAAAAAAASSARQQAGYGGGGGAAATAFGPAATAFSQIPANLSVYSSAPTSASITLAMASSPGATASNVGYATASATSYITSAAAAALAGRSPMGLGSKILTQSPSVPSPSNGFGCSQQKSAAAAPSGAGTMTAVASLAGAGAAERGRANGVAPSPGGTSLAIELQSAATPRPPGGGPPSTMASIGCSATVAAGGGGTASTAHDHDDDGSSFYPDTTSLPLPTTIMLSNRAVAAGAATGSVTAIAAAAAAAASPSPNGRGSSSRMQQLSGSGSVATTAMARTYTATSNSTLTFNSTLTPSVTLAATTTGGIMGYSLGGGSSSVPGGGGCAGGGASVCGLPAESCEWQWQQQHKLLIRAGISNADSESAAAQNASRQTQVAGADAGSNGVEMLVVGSEIVEGAVRQLQVPASAAAADDGAIKQRHRELPLLASQAAAAGGTVAAVTAGTANGNDPEALKLMATIKSPPVAPAGTAPVVPSAAASKPPLAAGNGGQCG